MQLMSFCNVIPVDNGFIHVEVMSYLQAIVFMLVKVVLCSTLTSSLIKKLETPFVKRLQRILMQ